jgi:hypothetical protein
VDEIDPAVANVRDLGAVLVREHRDDRRARPVASLERRHRPDACVRFLDRALERDPGARRGGSSLDDLHDRLDRELGGLLATGVATHAVAHDSEETERGLLLDRGVLVDLLVRIAAWIGPDGDLDSGDLRSCAHVSRSSR